MFKKWTQPEIAFLRDNYEDMEHVDMGLVLGRTRASVRNKCWRLGFRKHPRPWTDAEDAQLKQFYGDAADVWPNLTSLAAKMGRCYYGVAIRASRLGLGDRTRTKPGGRKDFRKFKGDNEALRKHLSETQLRWHAENEHPRGMKGKHHSEKTKERLRQTTLAYCARITLKQREEMTLKARKSKLERYGTLAPPAFRSNPYTYTRGGIREDLGFFVRSSWEANYARYLKFLEDQGKIQSWEYEPDIFVFHGEMRGSISYTPDFKITENDGRVVYHEIKGWMDSKSKTKLKRMKKHYPEVELIVIGPKEYKELAKYARLVEHWED